MIYAGKREPRDAVARFKNTKRDAQCDSCGMDYVDKKPPDTEVVYELGFQVFVLS